MTTQVESGGRGENADLVSAAQAGDESAFGELTARYRLELQAHCYRMLGSYHESEDMVQETFLRAWRKREAYQGRATFRAWLYRIATNACLDLLDQRSRTPLTGDGALPGDPGAAPLPAVAVPWLQPCPEPLVDAVEAKETLELAFLAAIQHLSPHQRAVLILRDVLGWSAKETASVLEATLASVNSTLQRARPALKKHLPRRRIDWTSPPGSSEQDRAVLRRYMAALDNADADALGDLLRADARCGQQSGAGGNMGPDPIWYSGRDTILGAWSPALRGDDAVEFATRATSANGQLAVATYTREPGTETYRAFGLTVLDVVDGLIAELGVFTPDLYPAFGLPRSV
ncbi:sigma-70 family RNA polymerase sigma factor [Amycolatopsis rubida]|uniref:Sigma-70 family RNA polymerase sigma factor n=1 Tax=Amycolatopsis rubida TaxID=112413 RepID=A0ABX0BTS9_9PSEU|nr:MULTISPECIES: RNA polymerase subunit sigma-70 [Amycolatopsis]MYW93961.1 sigma-70 family RNA polymerase sigma factor [Amycolatopsis rubida]NEC58950.1 sigma-70 family RNA polymerase sigma factor [Amycolatopsis rubida]